MKKSPLNILFLCSWYPNPDNKSNGIFIQRHAQALATKHNVTVVFAKSIDGLLEPVFNKKQTGLLTEYTYFYPKVKNKIFGLNSFIKLITFYFSYKKLINKIPSNQLFDVIHVNTIFPAAIPAFYCLKKYSNAKLFITEHWSGYYPEDDSYKRFLMRYFTKKLVSKANATLVISNKLKLAMQAHQLNSNYELINNVVDTSVFKAQSNELNEKVENTLQLLHVSSLVNREKNITGIIQIVEGLVNQNKNIHLTIIGENNIEINEYKELILQKALGKHITFVGYKTATEITDYMNQSDLFLLFSNFEGMPVVILESLACGLPVITTSVGEIPFMVKSDMGIVLNANSISECVEKIITFNRADFASKATMHQYIIDNYGVEAVCTSITNLYYKYSS